MLMADVHDEITRSYNMSQIKSKNTKPEMIVRKFLFANGLRYKLHDKNILGKPDVILPKYKTLIFVNGCFWHGHDDCKYFVIPKTRADWWLSKIEKTKHNDVRNYMKLNEEGWNIIIIYECELKRDKKENTLNNILNNLKNNLNA
jgi:DNA mismatch endonuclease (patch repair protein)